MIKTDIQLPEELFEKAKQSCNQRGMSFAEFAQRGIEYMVDMDRSDSAGGSLTWSLPTSEGRKIQWSGLSDQQIKEIAQESYEKCD